VLQQLAKALRISAEQLYVQAGILNPDDGQVRSVELAILGDPVLTERQKQALLDVYQSFRTVTENLTTTDEIEPLPVVDVPGFGSTTQGESHG
jgi:hypothetical protein